MLWTLILRALEWLDPGSCFGADPGYALAWYNLGTCERRDRQRRRLRPEAVLCPCFGALPWLCYSLVITWEHVNGGTVSGVAYDRKQCYLRALELDPGYGSSLA